MDSTLDDQIVWVREIASCQTHPLCHAHVAVPNMIIIHVQSHSQCNQDAAMYGNVIKFHRDAVFKHSQMARSRKHGGLFIKNDECNDSRFVISQIHKECL